MNCCTMLFHSIPLERIPFYPLLMIFAIAKCLSISHDIPRSPISNYKIRDSRVWRILLILQIGPQGITEGQDGIRGLPLTRLVCLDRLTKDHKNLNVSRTLLIPLPLNLSTLTIPQLGSRSCSIHASPSMIMEGRCGLAVFEFYVELWYGGQWKDFWVVG